MSRNPPHEVASVAAYPIRQAKGLEREPEAAAAAIGAPVEVAYRPASDAITLPRFRPAAR